jgi:hypothetical protein
LGDTDANSLPVHPVYIIVPGQTSTLTINRPEGLPADRYMWMTLQIADGAVATFPDGKAQTFLLLNSNEAATSISIRGVGDGTTALTVDGRAAGGDRYAGSSAIEVGSSYSFNPSPVELLVAEMLNVDLRRHGAFVGSKPASRASIRTLDDMIADTATDLVVMTTDVRPITFTGLSPGTTIVSAVDEENDLRTEVEVRVYQQVTLDHDLRISPTGLVHFRAGTKIRQDRLSNYTLWGPHTPFCSDWHLHAAGPEGVLIDGQGPYPDPAPTGCGYGRLITPPSGGRAGYLGIGR